MSTAIRMAVILGLVCIPSLARAAGPAGDSIRQQCGGGFVPANGPERPAGPSTGPAVCADGTNHPSAPHVHGDGRWIGHLGSDDLRYQLARPFDRGRFPGATGSGHIYTLRGGREPFAAGGASFSVAPFEYQFCEDWRWGAEPVAIYEDPDHSGWYLAYSVRLGTFVHVQHLGPEEPAPPARKPSALIRIASFLARSASTLGK